MNIPTVRVREGSVLSWQSSERGFEVSRNDMVVFQNKWDPDIDTNMLES